MKEIKTEVKKASYERPELTNEGRLNDITANGTLPPIT
mgnify:CR=1 FL=1